MDPVIVFTCDEWQSYSSMRLYGVFTNRAKLEGSLKAGLREEVFEMDDKTLKTFESGLSVGELNMALKYAYLEEVELNERIV